MTVPHFADDLVTVYAADCLHLLPELAACSVDAVVTDPPYGLEFMGREWDAPWKASSGDVLTAAAGGGFQDGYGGNPYTRSRIRYGREGGDSASFGAWCEAWLAECLRVLKPGGHLLAFGGSRTWHRLACAVEDVGFEVRDSIAWLYGQGFPKSLDVSKAIDRAAGAEREVVGVTRKGMVPGASTLVGNYQQREAADVTAPATEAAQVWEGWGTALKPAFEPIVVGRKPLAGTVAGNVLTHGVGALNVDACRTAAPGEDTRRNAAGGENGLLGEGTFQIRERRAEDQPERDGRWPTNVLLDESQAAELDRQSGNRPGMRSDRLLAERPGQDGLTTYGRGLGATEPGERLGYDDEGGASRFFPTFRYEAKAPTIERPRDGQVAHPTVKPLDLMRWLVRLVTPPGGTVLEPFAGSGTTAEACVIEGMRCVAIEREPTYLPLIVARLTKPIQPDLFGGLA